MSNPWSSPETAERVHHYLREHVDEHGRATCSWQTVGEALGIGRNTVGTAVRRLIDTGVISIARVGTGRDYPTSYDVPSSRDDHHPAAA